jgi:hypothetical protein
MIDALLKPFAPTSYNDVTEAFQKGAFSGVLNSEKPVVVLYPCAHAVGSSVIRAFMDTGIPVLAVDHKPQAAGLYSRLATPLLIPSLRKSEEHFVEEFVSLGKLFKVKPVLIFVDDDDVFLSLKRANEFKSAFRLQTGTSFSLS